MFKHISDEVCYVLSCEIKILQNSFVGDCDVIFHYQGEEFVLRSVRSCPPRYISMQGRFGKEDSVILLDASVAGSLVFSVRQRTTDGPYLPVGFSLNESC